MLIFFFNERLSYLKKGIKPFDYHNKKLLPIFPTADTRPGFIIVLVCPILRFA